MNVLVFMLFGIMPMPPSNNDAPFVEKEFACTLSASGYGDMEGIGRIPVELKATARTCEEAAAILRPQIIEMKFRISK